MNLPYQAHSSTSKAAALAYADKADNVRHRVYLMIDYYTQNGDGLTDEEITDILDLNPSTERPRRVELVQRLLVEDSGRVRQTRSGMEAVVWVTTSTASYSNTLFSTSSSDSVEYLTDNEKVIAEIEKAIPVRKRSPQLNMLLARLRDGHPF
jgi:hypothetical protein